MNGMVELRPVVVVAAYVRWVVVRRGRRNWESQPAPRTRMSTLGKGLEEDVMVVVVEAGWGAW